MENFEELTRKLDELTGTMREVVRVQNESRAGSDGTRKAEALVGAAELASQMSAIDAARQEAADASDRKARNDEVAKLVDEAVKAALRGTRGSSMADVIGQGTTTVVRSRAMLGLSGHPTLKAALGEDYVAGSFLTAVQGIAGNPDDYQSAKAWFATYGIDRADVPSESKATLGTTGALGGYVLPNNLVDTLKKPKTQAAVLQTLVTVINGVNVRGVDQPYRLGTPPRMTFQDWGATKENLNETYGSYTASLGTLARVYDISKQYARFSAGAAEQDVLDELGKAATLGENYYMMAGAGTGSGGYSGDPTYGIYTALAASTAFTNVNKAFASASLSTVAGSFANACAQAQGWLAQRSREAEAFISDATTFWTAIGEGSDTAGFWVSPAAGPTGFTRTASGGLAYWGIPVYYDSNLGTAAATKILIGGEFSACKLYRGMEFRVETSDQAGTRWDQNLIGFRGEEEIGFHAGTAVNTGALQLMTAVIP